MTIRSTLLAGSAGLIEGLDNFSIMISGGVGALEEAIHAIGQHLGCPNVGHTTLQSRQKTSPFFTLLLDILPSFNSCGHILSVLVLVPAESLP
jgi:hypothetical protein